MASFEHTITISRPVEEVFAFVTDYEKDAQWRSGVEEAVMTSDGPIGVGSTYRGVERFLGRKIESTSEITEFEVDKRFSFKATSGPIPFKASMSFETHGGGTQLSMVAEAELGGFFRIAEPIVVRVARRQIETEMANLKDLLEKQE